MSDEKFSEWRSALMAAAKRHRQLFVHLGAMHDATRKALISSNDRVIPAEDFVEYSSEAFDGREVVIVDSVESCISGVPRLGALRQCVSIVSDEAPVVLLSRAPRVAFRPVPGSSLMDDCRYFRPPTLARGSGWADYFNDSDVPEAQLHAVVRELGPEVCSSVDKLVTEDRIDAVDALDLLTDRELEALEGAGLVSQADDNREWIFPKHLAPLKRALSDVLAEVVTPQEDFSVVSGGLWEIERRMRREVRRLAIAHHGDRWRKRILNEAQQRCVLDRATESAYLGVQTMSELRDPLEWLSLGELLELMSTPGLDGLGLSEATWRNFKSDLFPIRNRVAHMRLLHSGDRATVSKWLNFVRRKWRSA